MALLTPYIEDLSKANAEMLESMGGFHVVNRSGKAKHMCTGVGLTEGKRSDVFAWKGSIS